MEKQENKHEELRVQLRAIAAEGDPHFAFISIEKLTDADIQLYQRLLDDSLTEAELMAYDASLVSEIVDPLKDSRSNFTAYLRNELVKNHRQRHTPPVSQVDT